MTSVLKSKSEDHLAHYNRLKENYHRWVADGLPGGDIVLAPILALLNQLHGITTVFSCEGHPEDGNERFYITCMGFDDTTNVLEDILSLYMEKYYPTLSSIFGWDSVLALHTHYLTTEKSDWYKVHSFVTRVTEDTKDEFIRTFQKAVEEYVSQHQSLPKPF